MPQPPKKRAKPLGKAIQWSDDDLDQLAQISVPIVAITTDILH